MWAPVPFASCCYVCACVFRWPSLAPTILCVCPSPHLHYSSLALVSSLLFPPCMSVIFNPWPHKMRVPSFLSPWESLLPRHLTTDSSPGDLRDGTQPLSIHNGGSQSWAARPGTGASLPQRGSAALQGECEPGNQTLQGLPRLAVGSAVRHLTSA